MVLTSKDGDGKKIDATIEYIKPEKHGGFWF